jgi:hypothetical protein
MGEITRRERKAAIERSSSLAPRSRKKSTVEVRKATITSVASDPAAWR